MISWKDCVNKSAENEKIQDIQSYLLKESSAYKEPIDAFYTEVKKIVMYSSDIQMLEENDFLGPLLFVGIISGTENYIREILTECIKTDSYYVYINSIYISGIYRFHTWYTGVLQNCTGRKRGLMWQN